MGNDMPYDSQSSQEAKLPPKETPHSSAQQKSQYNTQPSPVMKPPANYTSMQSTTLNNQKLALSKPISNHERQPNLGTIAEANRLAEESKRQRRNKQANENENEWKSSFTPYTYDDFYLYEECGEIEHELPQKLEHEEPEAHSTLRLQTLPPVQIICKSSHQAPELVRPPWLTLFKDTPKATQKERPFDIHYIPPIPATQSPEVNIKKRTKARILHKNPLLNEKIESYINKLSHYMPEEELDGPKKQAKLYNSDIERFFSPIKRKVWGIEQYRNRQDREWGQSRLQGAKYSMPLLIEKPQREFQFPLRYKKPTQDKLVENKIKFVREKGTEEDIVDTYLGYSKYEAVHGVLEKSHFPQVPANNLLAQNTVLQRVSRNGYSRSKSGDTRGYEFQDYNPLAACLKKQRMALEKLQAIKEAKCLSNSSEQNLCCER
eukprot:TRINITY_DN1351_c0_g1_i1.p1 TRINITY_DN1351_c0_g1~~TRINITY_DN1351_c0_g1_i1.p1  ORF type:complete len:433 (+),score=39.90 TRINITY_DN1351_c0_g1_i1:55-1353(+)